MKPIRFFAQGLPKGQPRPRAFARKIGQKFVARIYEAGTAESWKSCVAEAARTFLGSDSNYTLTVRPLGMSLIFLFPRPKAHFHTGKQADKIREDAPIFHTSKPDADNLSKAVLDALKTIGMIADDAQVCQLDVTKLYSAGHRTGCAIEIKEPCEPFPSNYQVETMPVSASNGDSTLSGEKQKKVKL